MENYICINGKKTELTDEQLKQLGIEVPKKNPFDRAEFGKNYYFITSYGTVFQSHEFKDSDDRDKYYDTANYCTDYHIMEQRALHETLSRLLWRYSMTHKAERKDNKVWHIRYSRNQQIFAPYWDYENSVYIGENAFDTEEIAQNAIDEIILPFMKAHPEFQW